MKKLSIQLILLIILGSSLIAQVKSSKPYDMKDNSRIEKKNESDKSSIFSAIPERVITTSVIVGEILILLFVLYYWKKTKDDDKTGSKNTFKNNIKAIREERINPKLITKMDNKRGSLENRININSINGKTISSTARKLSIAKGELFLIAKINQLQNQSR